jgi:YHS domain-containing protein
MKKNLTFLVLTLGIHLGYAQSDVLAQKHFNVKSNIALEGFDPVSYFTGKPKEGAQSFRHTVNGVTYHFSSAANLKIFRENPTKFEPAYGGWCAYAMGVSGEKVKVDPETFKIIDGKLYLFYNFWGNNTLEDWNNNQLKLKSEADRNWHAIILR